MLEAIARRPLVLAMAAAALVLAWQETQVQWRWAGNRSGLFQTARATVLPPELNGTARSARPYDGQWYRIVARDPWAEKGWPAFTDDAALRYRRILLPAMVWLLGGSDFAFQVVLAAFLALGVYSSAIWLEGRGVRAYWSLVFLLLPGVVLGLQWMTIDVAFYGTAAAALAAWQRRSASWCWIGAAAACLARDLGFIVCAAMVGASLAQRHRRQALWFAAAAVPALLWYAVVEWRFPATTPAGQVVPRWILHWPLVGALDAVWGRDLLPPHADFPPLGPAERITIGAYLLAFAGTFHWVRRGWQEPAAWMAVLLAGVFFAASSRGYWNDPLSHPRAFSPWLALLAALGNGIGHRAAVAPLAIATACGLLYLGAP